MPNVFHGEISNFMADFGKNARFVVIKWKIACLFLEKTLLYSHCQLTICVSSMYTTVNNVIL